MLDLIKFDWQNRNGVWIGPAWRAVVQNTTVLERYLRSGRPGMQDYRILDREPIPESIRFTGLTGTLVSYITLYHPDKRKINMTAAEFVNLMNTLLTECPDACGWQNNANLAVRNQNTEKIRRVLTEHAC